MDQKMTVRRVYACKRPGFDIEAAGLLKDLQVNLGLSGLHDLRIYNRYDVSGLTDEQYRLARNLVFSEPPVDDLYDEPCDFGQPDFLLAVEALPGQYDQRADSAAQCLQILTCDERPLCKTARIYAFGGSLDDKGKDKIRKWLINPVEAREASLKPAATLLDDIETPADIEWLNGFISMDQSRLDALLAQGGFAMSAADLRFTQEWFRREGRDPSWTELRVLDTYWSDHCRHTTFSTRIDSVAFPEDDPIGRVMKKDYQDYLAARRTVHGSRLDEKPVCLMDLATIAMKELRRLGKLADLDQSPEINACSIRVSIPVDGKPEEYLVMFKNETHNHPTEIEPFGGAATCLGGAIRDPLSGRSYVYQAMRVTGSGDPTVPVTDTLPGKLPQRKITTTAAAGYSSYGNQIGLATGQVEEFYHPGYQAKRMEIGAVIGAAPASHVRREIPQPGDLIILLGGRTGRDGCGGATGSSKAHDEQSILRCGSEVQKGNPPTERKIQRLFRKPEVAHMIKRCNDFGAGGVSVAIGELADGLRIDLDKVPRKYEGLDGTELAISESQERMAVVTAAEDAAKLIAAADRENLEAVVVAEVTAEPRMVMTWRNKILVDLSRTFIDTNGAPQQTRVSVAAPDQTANWFDKTAEQQRSHGNFTDNLRAGLSSLAACSRQGLVERFDSTIGAGTVLMPFGGVDQLTPEEGMAALIPVSGDSRTDACSLMAFGFDPDLSSWSPYHGAFYAVLESLAKITALGGDAARARLTFQEYFERMTGENSWGKPLSALLGAFRAQMDCAVPAIGGKDSMSGSFMDLQVPPTLVSFAVQVGRAGQIVSAAFRKPDQVVWLLPVPLDPGNAAGRLPDAKLFMTNLAKVHALSDRGLVQAAATVKQSGVAVACAKMCFGNRLGFIFNEAAIPLLFAPQPAALLLAFDAADAAPVEADLLGAGACLIGRTSAESFFQAGADRLTCQEALSVWQKPLERVFPTRADLSQPVPVLPFMAKQAEEPVKPHSTHRSVRPRVFIPVFPGTNCEFDTARAFSRAGADPDVLIIRNLTSSAIRETLAEMEKRIAKAQIVMLPGGFSGGDEPEGSGKFIAAAFRNPGVAEQVQILMEQRDGLILGICNGFQALIKLGLLPFGRIEDLTPDSPTLTFNRIGRHVSRYVTTRILSNRSPWLQFTNTGELHQIPVSHGEGRFVASPELIARLAEQGQIATQYVDPTGRASGLTLWNPNGSMAALEGLTSPDGRIFGKMGHSERSGPLLAKNIPGCKDQKLFEAGVAYFHF
ncbi:MAG: phosphoribosylformylglycinamidine synthase [Clostridiaceae bacterium]|nr:phosphoribosylformylglycinamidine synthase [Clostridiaceae bacterium]